MSCLEENMDRSAVKDAVLKQKFWVNKGIIIIIVIVIFMIIIIIITGSLSLSSRSVPDLFDINLVELTVDEIINGKDNEFMGIIPGTTITIPSSLVLTLILIAILNYLEALKCNQQAIDRIKPYLDHISLKAAGTITITIINISINNNIFR